MMTKRHREPFTALLRSLWDCFWNPMPSETWEETFHNIHRVIHFWLWPEDWDLLYDEFGKLRYQETNDD